VSNSPSPVSALIDLAHHLCRSRKNSDGGELDDQHQPTFLTSDDAPKMRKINALGIIPQGYELGGILFGYWKKWGARPSFPALSLTFRPIWFLIPPLFYSSPSRHASPHDLPPLRGHEWRRPDLLDHRRVCRAKYELAQRFPAVDRTAVADRRIPLTVVPELQAINNQRMVAYQQGILRGPPQFLPHLEHLWVICDVRLASRPLESRRPFPLTPRRLTRQNTDPSIKDRMQDLLSRRRQFHTLENYLRLHPTVDPAIFKPDLSYVPKDRNNWVNQQVRSQSKP
jgi:hypothetical protein